MRTYGQQKAALTRAERTGNPEKVRAECVRVKAEWDANYWPDDWSRWQRSLTDIYPPFEAPQLDEL